MSRKEVGPSSTLGEKKTFFFGKGARFRLSVCEKKEEKITRKGVRKGVKTSTSQEKEATLFSDKKVAIIIFGRKGGD